jgi:Mrr N-terminal domain
MTLPMVKNLERPLLRELVASGGEAKPEEMYVMLPRHFPNLGEEDIHLDSNNRHNLWQKRIRYARQNLVLRGDMFREPRGLWRITLQGRQQVEGTN